MSEKQKFRLVTRSDFDGLVCAVLLEELDMIDDILFVHPNDMQQGRITIQDTDITTNLPYISGVHLAFDHHESEVARAGELADNHIIDADAPSAARVVYDYYGGKETFPKIDEALMAAVDQADSAQFSMEEVLNPAGWPLLSFIIDHAGRRRRIGVDDVVIGNFPGTGNFTFMMVKGQVHAGDIGQVGGDVGILDRDPALLHVVGMDEQDVVDHIQLLEQDGADKAIEVASRDQTEFLFFGHGFLPAPGYCLTALPRSSRGLAKS